MNKIFPMAIALSSAMVVAGCGGSSGKSVRPGAVAPSSSSSAALNGEQTKTPKQVLTDAKSALFAAPSVHVAGAITEKGETGKINLIFQGQDSSGTVSIGSIALDVVKVGGQQYLKAPAAFWDKVAGSSVGSKLANKWIKASAGTTLGTSSLTLQSIAAQLGADDKPLKPALGKTAVDGKPAVVLTETDNSELVVANTGKPFPLRITPPGGSKGVLTFTDYGKTQTIKAPAGAMTAEQAAKAPSTGTA